MGSTNHTLCNTVLLTTEKFPHVSEPSVQTYVVKGQLYLETAFMEVWASQARQWYRIRLPMKEMQVQSLGQGELLEKEMATHSLILLQEIPWIEEPGGVQSKGFQSQTQLSE